MKVLLIAYDNGSFVHCFPQGLAYIASALRNAGHEITIYNQDQYHYPESHLTDFLNHSKFDVVGLGVIAGYYQYRKLLQISKAINTSANRPFYILGGHGPSPELEYFLSITKADAIVAGEGEVTAVELLETLADNRDLSSVSGIAFFNEKGKMVVTLPREPIKDIDSIPFPAWDLFPMDYYALLREPYINNNERCFPVLTGRGCTFKCNFCYRMDKGFRPRRTECIIEEIELLKNKYHISYITFTDELLMSSASRTSSLCEDFIRAELNIKWACNGRLNYAKPDILRLMKKAGCVFINYGIEAMDNQILKNMNKALTTEQIIKGVEATLNVGISPGLNVIFGNIGENIETLKKGVEFLLKYDNGTQMRTIKPVTPYPGSPLYYYAIENGLLKDCEDFYKNKHINSDLLSINFTDMSNDEFHKSLLEANTRLIRNYFQKKEKQVIAQAKKLYLEEDSNFRGFRQT